MRFLVRQNCRRSPLERPKPLLLPDPMRSRRRSLPPQTSPATWSPPTPARPPLLPAANSCPLSRVTIAGSGGATLSAARGDSLSSQVHNLTWHASCASTSRERTNESTRSLAAAFFPPPPSLNFFPKLNSPPRLPRSRARHVLAMGSRAARRHAGRRRRRGPAAAALLLVGRPPGEAIHSGVPDSEPGPPPSLPFFLLSGADIVAVGSGGASLPGPVL
jgi:hypothetical protein